MKNFWKFSAAAVIVTLAACTKEQDLAQQLPEEETGAYEYTFYIDGDDATKTVLGNSNNIVWEANDRVGTFAGTASGTPSTKNKYSYVTPSDGETKASFRVYLQNALHEGDKIWCYYPYNSSMGSPSSLSVGLSIPVNQTQTIENGFDMDAMTMVSVPYTVTEDMASGNNQKDNLRFLNLGSFVEFKVYSSYDTYREETIRSVEFNSNDAIAGGFTFNLPNVDPEDESTLKLYYLNSTTVTTSINDAPVPATKADAQKVYMVVAPGNHSGTITVTTDKATYTYTLPEREFNRSSIRSFGLDLASATVTRNPEVVTFVPTNASIAEMSGIEISYDKTGAGNYPAWNVTSNEFRFYSESMICIDSDESLSRIEFFFRIRSGKQYVETASTNCGTLTLGGVPSAEGEIVRDVWTGSSTYVLYTLGKESGHQRVLEKIIFYKENASTPDPGPGPDPGPDPIPDDEDPDLAPFDGWLELPAYATSSMTGTTTSTLSDLQYLTHRALMGGKIQRNYTMLYDPDMFASYWIAYPLCKSHMTSGRVNSFNYDPRVPSSKQTNIRKGGYGVNIATPSHSDNYFARGHQIPSADRSAVAKMQEQTFYATNMTPQIQNGFNGHCWNYLEGAVRGAVPSSTSDTLYVVSGAAFKKKGGSETINYITNGNDGYLLPVPNYYWKALLKVKRDSFGNVTGALTCGFWLDHADQADDNWTNCAVTVSQIEEWTGFDLFHNLPDAVEATAETNSNWSTFLSY